jgi:hypothetical protein
MHNRGRAALKRRVKRPKWNRALARVLDPAPANKNGASPKGPAPSSFTLYYQNIKPKGVDPPQLATLYFYPNERLTKK